MLTLVGRMDEGMSHLMLLAVPTFIFLGQLLEMTGMARAMIQCLASLLGHIRGGLSYVLVGAMYLVSGISGSKAADMAAIAPALFPEMIKRGAKPGELVALLSATGAQTETVPPSIVLITVDYVEQWLVTDEWAGGGGHPSGGTFKGGPACWHQSGSAMARPASRGPRTGRFKISNKLGLHSWPSWAFRAKYILSERHITDGGPLPSPLGDASPKLREEVRALRDTVILDSAYQRVPIQGDGHL
jgi:hypothetical protein